MSESSSKDLILNDAEEGGIIKVQKFELPLSSFLSDESKRQLRLQKEKGNEYLETVSAPIDLRRAPLDKIPMLRAQEREIFSSSPLYISLIDRYKTSVKLEDADGVGIETFLPVDGVSSENRERVLINLHGGSFLNGSQTASHYESIPISAVGKFKVVSVDYRMAPEYQFPAASDDVVKVYKHLLKEYKPENIGIYGSSAGAVLTAQTIARIQREGLPLPGASAMLAAGAYYWMEGDSGAIGGAISGIPSSGFRLEDDLYFKGVDSGNTLAFPGKSSEIMSKFPPSLLLASVRDFALSSVVNTHAQLVKQGVEADLHIWDGLDHVFYANPDIPESHEVYDVVVKFFNKHLGFE